MQFLKMGSLVVSLVLIGCASAEQKQQSKWQVKVKKESDERMWIAKLDGSKQCEGKSKFTPDAAARELTSAGVLVFQKRNGNDGRIYPSSCGSGTGRTVELEISPLDLKTAQSLGYNAVKAN